MSRKNHIKCDIHIPYSVVVVIKRTNSEKRLNMRNNIKKIRELKGVKQTALAKMLDTYAEQISRLEKKDYDAEFEWLIKIAKVLNVTVLDLIFDDKDFQEMGIISSIKNSAIGNSGTVTLYPQDPHKSGTLDQIEQDVIKMLREMDTFQKADAILALKKIWNQKNETNGNE